MRPGSGSLTLAVRIARPFHDWSTSL